MGADAHPQRRPAHLSFPPPQFGGEEEEHPPASANGLALRCFAASPPKQLPQLKVRDQEEISAAQEQALEIHHGGRLVLREPRLQEAARPLLVHNSEASDVRCYH